MESLFKGIAEVVGYILIVYYAGWIAWYGGRVIKEAIAGRKERKNGPV